MVTCNICDSCSDIAGAYPCRYRNLPWATAAVEKNGVSIFLSRPGLAQANRQVLNQLTKVSSALLIAERNAVEFTALLRVSTSLG